MKKINIIGTVGLPATYGGWETLVENLVRNFQKKFDITVFCSAQRYDIQPPSFLDCKLDYINLNANGWQSIIYDLAGMLKSLKSDYMLILGVSGCAFLPFIKLIYNGKIIVNIDGLEWRRDKWSKPTKLFLKFSEFLAVKFSDIVITDNAGIQQYVSNFYKTNSVLIPYGADHVLTPARSKSITSFTYKCFKVCRIEPENNIQLILQAFSELPTMELKIVGNWNNSLFGLQLRNKYSIFDNIIMLDPIYDIEKLNAYRCDADIYIHGHSAGGTNPSLVEAMYLGLPIFAYDVIYNIETTKNLCSYFKTKEQLITLLKSATSSSLTSNAEDMKKLAYEFYTWDKISQQYSDLFQ